ncbi:MAG: hypothetical protein WAJ92_09100 [Candidatus Acidiferrales bacterium]
MTMTKATILHRSLLILALAIVVAYGADYLLLRLKMTGSPPTDPSVSNAAFGSVTYYLSAGIKGNKYEVFTEQPQQETCVHSLFPHFNDPPCWYSARRRVRSVN